MPQETPNPRSLDDDSLIQGKNWFSRKILFALYTWTPKCNEMTHLISKEMDDPLPWSTSFKMQVHYLICCYCQRYKDNLHYMRYVLQRFQDRLGELSAVTLSLEAKERMKQILRDQPDAS
jgi:hypothetical protein